MTPAEQQLEHWPLDRLIEDVRSKTSVTVNLLLHILVKINQISVRHLMVIWAKSNQIIQSMFASILSWNDVMYFNNNIKSTDLAFPSISVKNKFFKRAARKRSFAIWFGCAHAATFCFSSTFGRAIPSSAAKSFWGYQKRFSANIANVLNSFVLRMIFGCPKSAKIVSAGSRAKFPVCQVGHNFSYDPAMHANKGSARLSVPFVVPRYKFFSSVGGGAASALTQVVHKIKSWAIDIKGILPFFAHLLFNFQGKHA
jgi:hypothetical protein